jgi:nitroreductase
VNALDVYEAIKRRRSMRKFKKESIPQDQIEKLIEVARLAPSGSNVQPWRFIIVKDNRMKSELCKASYKQKFVEDASIVIVCCGDLLSWKRVKETSREILKDKQIQLSKKTKDALEVRTNKAAVAEMYERIPSTMLNVAIAIEHIALEAVELGLGSCWVRLFDEKKIKQTLNLPDHLYVVAILPIGVPDEDPPPRPRMSVSEIISII